MHESSLLAQTAISLKAGVMFLLPLCLRTYLSLEGASARS